MLTKEHLKYRTLKGRVHPVFLDLDDTQLRSQVAEMIEQVQAGIHQSLEDLNQNLDRGIISSAKSPLPGLRKLFLDQCIFNEPPEELYSQRWEWIQDAQKFRVEGLFPTKDAFQKAFAESIHQPFDTIRQMYHDLPKHRTLSQAAKLSVDQLIHRYNVAQIQGLLIRSREVKVSIANTRPQDRRQILQAAKFHRLLVRLPQTFEKDQLAFDIDGPLSMFGTHNAYGIHLGNFFPRLIMFEDWSLEALVCLKGNKLFDLKLGAKTGLKSHYSHRNGYIPEEFTALAYETAKKLPEWSVEFDAGVIDLGQQVCCVPDMAFRAESKLPIYLELFHRWHLHTLKSRLDQLERTPTARLIIGVSRDIARKPEVSQWLNTSAYFQRNGLLFTTFPTTRSLCDKLSTFS